MGFEFDNSGRSFYVPSAFYISAAPGVLDNAGVPSPGGWPRLLHEYGHLIQDRTSVFGAIEFMHFVDSLHSMVSLLNTQGPVVALPISAAPSAQVSKLASIHALRAATNPRMPWRNGVWWAYEEHRIDSVTVWYEGKTRQIPVAIARFVNNITNDTYEHEIGPREIKEAYSVAIELLHGGPPVDDAKEFEYLAIERILLRIGPVDERQIVAVCHWALQDPVPGVRFFEILMLLEANGMMPAAPALYDVLRSAAIADGVAAKVLQVEDQLNEIVCIQQRAGTRDVLFQVLRWYRDQVVVALNRNLDQQRRFPLDSYLCEATPTGDFLHFIQAVAEEPIPSVETPSGASFAFGGTTIDSDSVLFIRALGDLLVRLWVEHKAIWSCVLYSTCNHPIRDQTCTSQPCDKGRLRPACPYGAAAAYLGFPGRRKLSPS